MAITVAIAGAGDIVESGLREILAHAPDLDVRDCGEAVPHVVVYDAVGILADGGSELSRLVDTNGSAVVVVGRDLRPGLAARAMASGALACVSLEAPAQQVIDVIRFVAAPGGAAVDPSTPSGLGQEVELTPREVLILAGIAKGMRNRDIAVLHALSPNTIKSYIRSAYRKMGVTTRSQAVSWCMGHGFESTDERLRATVVADAALDGLGHPGQPARVVVGPTQRGDHPRTSEEPQRYVARSLP
jgi:DNA-binding NarL/FixJ family response regulator